MTQAASNSHNVPNFMMCRHEHENLLNASVFDGADAWTQLKHSSNRWRCSRDPTYTAKPNCNAQILIHFKNGKDFNSSEHHLGRLLYCSRLMKGQKAGRATVTADPDSRHPPAEKTERTFVNCKTMITVQSCQRRNDDIALPPPSSNKPFPMTYKVSIEWCLVLACLFSGVREP